MKRILQLLSEGFPQSYICKEAHCSKRKVSACKKQVEAIGKSYGELLCLSDSEFGDIFMPKNEAITEDSRKAALDVMLPEIAKRLAGKHANVQCVYETYYLKETSDGYSYTQFNKHVRDYLDRNSLSMHIQHEPGEEWQIDFAGDALYLTDPMTGDVTKTVVLVCCMPFSNLLWMMALPSAATEYFYHGLNEGLKYMGALPQIAKSDNMKQWVTKSDRYSPTFSYANTEWCNYYSIIPTACRVRTPRDKGPVEGAVNQLYKYVYARIENEKHVDMRSLNYRIRELLDEYNNLPYRGSNRWRLFREYELPRMRELPPQMYRFRLRKEVKLGKTYHVCVGQERHFYSVPYKYYNKKVRVMWDAEYVEVYVGRERVCAHYRSHVPYGWSTEASHMPENHSTQPRCMMEADAVALVERATRIGDSVKWAVEDILQKVTFPQQAYGRCNAVMAMGATYGYNRLIKACQMLRDASASATPRGVQTILENRRDIEAEDPDIVSRTPYNSDVRGAEEFARQLSNLRKQSDK